MTRWDRLLGLCKRLMEDLDQGIRDFIDRETQDSIERSLSPDEARYAAKIPIAHLEMSASM